MSGHGTGAGGTLWSRANAPTGPCCIPRTSEASANKVGARASSLPLSFPPSLPPSLPPSHT
eukprot:453752-Rhodomonas_salina.1